MDEAVEDTIERLQRQERRRIRLAARRRNWFGWGNLHSVSATAVQQPLTRPMAHQHVKWNVAALAPVFFAVPLLALMVILFTNLWPHTHHTASAHAPAAVTHPKSIPTAAAPASGKTTLLLLGTDQRQGDKGYRTDVIVLLSIDADTGQVSAVSFPRDLWVKVPTLYEMKINSIMQLGGFDAMAGMFQADFGVKPDYYVLTNFEGFSRFVDLLRGVEVQVAQPLTDACDIRSLAVHGKCSVKPGVVWMEGTEALWYVRSRETTSDIDRLRRAQEVLVAIFKKMMTRNAILRIPQFESALKGNVETNMPFAKVLPLVPLADKVFNDTSLIKKFAINEDQSTPMMSWNGEWILLPDNQAIHAVLAQAGFFK